MIIMTVSRKGISYKASNTSFAEVTCRNLGSVANPGKHCPSNGCQLLFCYSTKLGVRSYCKTFMRHLIGAQQKATISSYTEVHLPKLCPVYTYKYIAHGAHMPAVNEMPPFPGNGWGRSWTTHRAVATSPVGPVSTRPPFGTPKFAPAQIPQ